MCLNVPNGFAILELCFCAMMCVFLSSVATCVALIELSCSLMCVLGMVALHVFQGSERVGDFVA